MGAPLTFVQPEIVGREALSLCHAQCFLRLAREDTVWKRKVRIVSQEAPMA
jgi:hypothetical protein